MKAKYILSTSLKTLAVTAPLFITTSLSALEKPAEKQKPKADVKHVPNERAGAPEEAENLAAKPVRKMAMLGVGGNAVSETLSTHLGIEEGTGLTIYHVVPDSAAAKAGIESHDIITAVDDKAVGSQNDLRDLIQNYKPGDEISVKLVHKGKVVEKKVTLGERMAAPVGEIDRARFGKMPEGGLQPLPMNDLFDMFKGMGGDVPEVDRKRVEQEMRKHMDDLRKQLRQLENDNGLQVFPKGLDMQRGLQMLGGTSVTIKDNDGSVTMKTKNDKKEVIVRDHDGKVIFEGPYDTEQDKAAVPDNIADRIKRVDMNMGPKKGGFRFDLKPR